MAILTELHLYPIKSCGSMSLREATLTPAGLMHEHIYDREWMVVDENGSFISQRAYPKMALISPRIKSGTMELCASGMLRLEIPLDLPDPDTAPTLDVEVWSTKVKAYDCDETTAVWFSNAIGTTCRLARFHPHARRLASEKWTGGIEAPVLFSDGFPVLVISQASLDDLNDKLTAQGRAPLSMNRFRPNIVIDGISAFEEDYTTAFDFGDCMLKPVKPCARCTIPSVDQSTAEIGPDPLDILRGYRVDPKVDGGITFGMNAILVEGEKQVLRVGQHVDAELAFE